MEKTTFKYRLYPSRSQETRLQDTLDVCRALYNSLLHDRKFRYEVEGKSPSCSDQQKLLPDWKVLHPELREVYSQVLQNVAKRVDRAFDAFFRRVKRGGWHGRTAQPDDTRSPIKRGGWHGRTAQPDDTRSPIKRGGWHGRTAQPDDTRSPIKRGGWHGRTAQPDDTRSPIKNGENPGFPRFKGKGQYDSITYPQSGFALVGEGVCLSKIGTLKLVLHRPIEGIIKTCTVRRQNGKWFVCFSCEVQAEALPVSEEKVGIDVGIEKFAALSTGEFIENPRFYRSEKKALTKAQRKFEQVKNKHRSPERKKAKKVVARIHERIRNKRHNFLHQTARQLVNRFGTIAVEELNILNMSSSPAPKPDPQKPGQFLANGHAAKAGLNKSILDAGWYTFRMILSTKAESAGRTYLEVNPAYTSQDCSGCGRRPPPEERKKLSDRWHLCPKCSLSMDRDTNSSHLVLQKAVGLHSLPVEPDRSPWIYPGE